MFDVTTYDLLMELSGAFYHAMGQLRGQLDPPLEALPTLLQVRGGYAESPGWYMIQAAEFDPEPLTVETLRVRDTYASPRLAQALLDLLASEQWLDRHENSYTLTNEGHGIINQLKDRSARMLDAINLPATTDIVRLEALMRRLIDASLACANPPGSWCLAHSRRRAPADSAPPLQRLFHYLTDFNAFRDDAHMAAFQPYEAVGYQWETFTYVMDGTAQTAEELFARLAYRGYSRHEFAVALAALTTRGWLQETLAGSRYEATDAGCAVRQAVEETTDRYFYQPWSALNTTELDDFMQTLQALGDQLHDA